MRAFRAGRIEPRHHARGTGRRRVQCAAAGGPARGGGRNPLGAWRRPDRRVDWRCDPEGRASRTDRPSIWTAQRRAIRRSSTSTAMWSRVSPTWSFMRSRCRGNCCGARCAIRSPLADAVFCDANLPSDALQRLAESGRRSAAIWAGDLAGQGRTAGSRSSVTSPACS